MADPRIRRAFDDLASVFAPPSATDLYAGARARATDEDARRRAEVYARASAPGARGQDLDLAMIAAGLYNPNQSYYAVDTKDATDRRGQDIASSDNRYNVDSRDRTARRGQDVAADVDLQRIIMAPTPKDAVVTRPPATAQRYGVPEQTIGVIAAQPGERNYLPNGQMVEGAPKPKTRAEVEGEIVAGLTPEEKRAIGFGNTPVVETNKGPMTRPQQLQTGTPAISDKSPQVFNTKNGPVMWDPALGTYVDPVSRRPVDISGGLQAPSAVQSKDPLGPTTANSTEANSKEAGLNVLDQAVVQFEDLLKANPGIVGIPGQVRGLAQNVMSTAQEFGAAFGNLSPDAKLAADQVAAAAAQLSAGRDPAIAKARVMQADLAYKWAQAQNPRGEVSRQAFERALDSLSGGAWANNQSTLEALQAVREFSQRERIGVSSLRQPGSGAPSGPTVLQTPKGSVTIERVQ